MGNGGTGQINKSGNCASRVCRGTTWVMECSHHTHVTACAHGGRPSQGVRVWLVNRAGTAEAVLADGSLEDRQEPPAACSY